MSARAWSGEALIAAFANDAPYLPMLVAFTREDKEAKGLRKLGAPDAVRPPVYFSALEAAASEPALLLVAPHGGGKTSFARDLALSLAGAHAGGSGRDPALWKRAIPRNDAGDVAPEGWSGPLPCPVYLPAEPGLGIADVAAVLAEHGARDGPILLIVDNAERLGMSGADFIAALGTLRDREPALRLLVLGEESLCRAWPLPEGFASHALLPLLASQQAVIDPATAPDAAPVLPEAFFLARESGLPAATNIDALVTAAAGAGVARAAERAWRDWGADRARATPTGSATRTLVLAARHLAGLPADTVLATYGQAPDRWTLPILRLADGYSDIHLLAKGLAATGPRGAVLAADLIAEQAGASAAYLAPALLSAIAGDMLPVALRDRAGRHLGRLGDPRDLEALVAVAGGRLTMGSATHPNSLPVHEVDVGAFRIGRFPVVNGVYARFVAETGRVWRSLDRDRPDRANAPAVDLSWHDARAFCIWLTRRWREAGRIAPDERVRLPTEPEWEHAARGDLADAGAACVYPWGGPWRPCHANSAEAGFNDTCAVGLFPAGRSAAGAEDMSGQIWEWTTTLWGRDPAAPDRAYPYEVERDEDAAAAADVRHVLRGGCFSSGRLKANCTYRGSLEPDGTWRGNGFRIVVSR